MRRVRGARVLTAPSNEPPVVMTAEYSMESDCCFLISNSIADQPDTYLALQQLLGVTWTTVDSTTNTAANIGSCVFGNEGGILTRFAVISEIDDSVLGISNTFTPPEI